MFGSSSQDEKTTQNLQGGRSNLTSSQDEKTIEDWVHLKLNGNVIIYICPYRTIC